MQAGSATRNTLGVASDAYDVYSAYRAMHTKALARAVVKGAFKQPPGEQSADPALQALHAYPAGPDVAVSVPHPVQSARPLGSESELYPSAKPPPPALQN